MSSPSPSSPPLTEAYLSPSSFLRSPQFHRTLTHSGRTISYAVAGFQPPPSTSASSTSSAPPPPTLLWLNGLGSHRLACVLFDGLFAQYGVRLITIDRPGAGRSTMCPLGERVRVSVEGTLAVLEKEGVKECSIMSHSNGIIYTTALLLHLARLSSSSSSSSSSPSTPPPIRILSWFLSSPFVPPYHSSSLPLSFARYIPPPLTASLGPLACLAQRVYEPFAKSTGWSAGVSGAVRELVLASGASGAWGAGVVSTGRGVAGGDAAAAVARAAGGGDEEADDPPPPSRAEAEKQRQRFRDLNAKRPPHKRLFGGEFYGPTLFSQSVKVVMGEGKMDGMGQEALLCLRQGEGGKEWGWFDGEEEEVEVEEGEMYEKAFGKLKEVWGDEPLPMSVVYGAEDGMVPTKGQEYLRSLLVDRLELVKPEDWQVVEEAGHDDPLGLECVAGPLLQRVLAVHGRGGGGEA